MSEQRKITRRGLLAAGSVAMMTGAAASNPKPNIVVILADDLGYGDLSGYGAEDLRSPNLDALAAAGVRFDQFYANSPVCSPTRAALLTGRFPDCAGVPGVIRTDPRNSWGYLSSQAPLLPQVLKTAGYRSALIGKWHLGLESPNTPNERGFDHFHGFLGDMMDDYRTHLRHGNNYMRRNREVINPQGHATDLFTDWAIEYVNDCKRDSKPFLLYLAYNAPHGPVQPPDEWLARVRERSPALSEKRMKLVALIEHLDASIGRVIAQLKSNSQSENTLILFLSDNGGDLGAGASSGRLRDGKGSMYEGGIRVPMCAVWHGHITPGLRCSFPAATMDLLPTLCEVSGAAGARRGRRNLDSAKPAWEDSAGLGTQSCVREARGWAAL